MPSTLDIRVEGMTCAHCARSVEKTLTELPGISAASADFASGNVRLTLGENAPGFEVMQPKVAKAGYRLLPAEEAANTDAADSANAAARNHLWMLLLGVLFTAPVLAFDWLHLHGPVFDWLAVALATTLQATVGLVFYKGAIANIRSRMLGMDVLVSIGMASGLIYGVLLVVFDWPLPQGLTRHVFFEAATLLVVFLRLGKFVEAKARGNALSALRSLLKLSPETARVKRAGPDNSVGLVEIPANEVQLGETCLVAPGGRVPVDGEITSGAGDMDESMLTGESVPVARKQGDTVRAGTISTNGALEVRATAIGSGTAIAHIVRMVEEAQRTKAPIQRLADRISNWFVPIVVLTALGAGIGWGLSGAGAARAITHAIAVLVIACPCALGIAVPAAVMIGSGAALRRGVLVKNGAALERIAKATIFAFDKTGTLTQGKPQVAQVMLAEAATQAQVDAALAVVGQASRHPFARAVAERPVKGRGSKVEGNDGEQEGSNPQPSTLNSQPAVRGFESPGKGLVAIAGERTILFGNAALMAEQDAQVPAQLAAQAQVARDAGHSVSFLAEQGRLLGAVAFTDALRPEAAEVLADLRARGMRLVLLSGDHQQAAARVAATLGITEVHAGISPAEKLARIDELKQHGVTAMVGDGINDAPALARADIGVAIGGGSDVAKETGDLVLMNGSLRDLPLAMDLGRRSMRAIRQNLFFSLVYNAVGIPLAAGALVFAGVFLPPSFAALSMVFSDLSVALNSARLAHELRKAGR
ncbi:MAG: cation-translocating P-type ATPase [Planctomycetes bacterium]|nr:cation-translocating P-type ATPase [Planctomycetota bacterium]